MFTRETTFAQSRTAKLAFVVDLVLVFAASLAAARSTFVAVATFAVGAPLFYLGARALHHYDFTHDRGPLNELALTTLIVAGVIAPFALASLLFDGFARAFDLGAFCRVLWTAIVLGRLIVRSGRSIAAATPRREILVIGAGPLARHTALEIGLHEDRRVLGFLTLPGDVLDGRLPAQTLGSDADLEQIFRAHAVDEVYVAGSLRRQGDAMQTAVRTCERFGIPFALPASGLRLDRARPSNPALADGYVHYLSIEPKPFQQMIKRAIDIVASTIALLLLSPLLLGVALAVKLGSKGPVFFRQARVGQYGRGFHMLKFRSMVVDAEALMAKLAAQNEQSGPVFKMKHDPRITAVGRFIRKYSIDELPQLVNVLRGEMTIVGPRPPIPAEVAKYEPWQRRRLSVRPGLTCLWQVSGRNDVSFERWMYLDMQYIDHWSLREDLRLILKTFPVVITGRGAS